MKYQITWQFVGGLEEPRTTIVFGYDKRDAVARLRRDHVDVCSPLRSDLKVIDVRPVDQVR